MQRRDFLRTAAAAAGTYLTARPMSAAETPDPLWKKLPRWRGFNLLEKFYRDEPFRETDFQWLREWGLDFVRLPMDYRVWTDAQDPGRFREKSLADIDQAIQFGDKYGVHVCLNLHNAPGYTVNQSAIEKRSLWSDEAAQQAFAAQWAMLAQRYRGLPSARVSFNLVNEPAKVEAGVYARVARQAIAAIRQHDPQRLIITDGLSWGREPIPDLVPDQIAQSTRGYEPMEITHYQASWVGRRDWPAPAWPVVRGATRIDRAWLQRDRIEPWKQLAARGVGVHVGEWGAFRFTPHDIVLRWAQDCLELWAEAGFGWALWNLRGAFGVVDSQRADVAYEDFHGHQLDRKLLDLLRAH